MNKEKQDYNDDPVSYCDNCLELTIKKLRDTNIDYCTKCGCTVVKEAHIYDWEEMYMEFYKERYVKGNRKLEE